MLLPREMRPGVSGDEAVHLVIQEVEAMKPPALTVIQRGYRSRQDDYAVCGLCRP
jgi:hypothetical protein